MPRAGRILIDDGVAYVARAGDERVTVRLSGKMRRAIRAGEAQRPVVGDHVTLGDDGLVVEVLARATRLARKAAGREDVEQVIAANVDLGLIATACGPDVNERRLERYLAVVRDGGVVPIVLLTKADTSADLPAELARVTAAAPNVEVISVSAVTGAGVDEVARRVAPDRTAALLGSSGVGKSTLLNRLVGEDRQRIGALLDDGTGRHTTTRRELFALPTGGWLVDTPGMREVGLLEADEGVDAAFGDLEALAEGCRFSDCRHEAEPGCAVRAAAESGAIDPTRLAAWHALRREIAGRRARRR